MILNYNPVQETKMESQEWNLAAELLDCDWLKPTWCVGLPDLSRMGFPFPGYKFSNIYHIGCIYTQEKRTDKESTFDIF